MSTVATLTDAENKTLSALYSMRDETTVSASMLSQWHYKGFEDTKRQEAITLVQGHLKQFHEKGWVVADKDFGYFSIAPKGITQFLQTQKAKETVSRA